MSDIILQDLWDLGEAQAKAPLLAQIASQTTEIADLTAQVADLEDQLANLPPPEPHPVPSAYNTGPRGNLANFATGLGTAHDTTIENRQSSTTTVTLNGANLALKNVNFVLSGAGGLNVQNAANFAMTDGLVNKVVTGGGTFIRCNMASLVLTGPSIVTDCYIPGGITGAGVAASTITNTTVVP